MQKISQDKIAQIREANPIEEVIGSYIPLKKAGKNFKALCPFHSEKVPSFSVSPERGVYHCFGCGKSGNVFRFLMEYNNLSFFEAVKFLGERVGIEVGVVEDENKDLYKVNEFVAKLYHKVLLSEKGEAGRGWLKSRDISDDTIEKFMLGYAPDESIIWERAKLESLKKENFEVLGLLKDFRDTFSRKVIFPIRDRWGRVAGFGTRVLDESLPKYINSQESPIFKKGNLLYGFYEARAELKKGAILVEGYTDLLTLHQSGMRNVVASLGTSLTQEQARLLKLYTQRVIIVYDGDSAGRKAAERAIDVLLEELLDVRVLPLPEDEDPDSFVRKKGRLDFSEMQSFVEFKYKECKSVEEKENLVRSFQESLSRISDLVKKEVWADEISRKLGIRKELLFAERIVPVRERTVSERSLEDLEVELLGIAASYPRVRELLVENSFDVEAPALKFSLSLVLKGAEVSEVSDSLPNDRLREYFTKTLFWEEIDCEKMATDYLNRRKEIRKSIERRELLNKIEKGELSQDVLSKYQNLLSKK